MASALDDRTIESIPANPTRAVIVLATIVSSIQYSAQMSLVVWPVLHVFMMNTKKQKITVDEIKTMFTSYLSLKNIEKLIRAINSMEIVDNQNRQRF